MGQIAYFRSKIWRHPRVRRRRIPIRCRNFGDSAINKCQIAYFSLRMRKTALFLLPVKNLTSPSCSPTLISYLTFILLDLFAWCVRLSRLLVGFRTHFKSLHFHSFMMQEFWRVGHKYSPNCIFFIEHTQNGLISTSCQKSDVTIVFPDSSFL